MVTRWRNVATGELQSSDALARRDLSERMCPSCGQRSLRRYLSRLERARLGPALLSQTWCNNCRKFTGSTGPMPTGMSFTDPLSGLSDDERSLISGVEPLFAELNRRWDRGELPQRFLD